MSELLSGGQLRDQNDPDSDLEPLSRDRARELWEKYRRAYPADFSSDDLRHFCWRRQAARDCEATENWEMAIRQYDRLVELEPGQPRWFESRGDAYFKLGQWRKAVRDYDAALKAGASNRDLWHWRGLANSALKEWDEAVKDFSEAIQANEHRWQSWYARGLAQGHRRQWTEVITDLTKAIKLKPDQNVLQPIWRNLGSAYAEQGQWKEAANAFEQAAATDPNGITDRQQAALARLAGNDRDGYRAICDYLRERLRRERDPEKFAEGVWVFGVVPEGGKHWGTTAIPNLDQSKPGLDKALVRRYGLALMAFHFRLAVAGERDKSIRETILPTLHQLDKLPGEDSYRAKVWLFLALAHQQLGEQPEAEKWLKRARDWHQLAASETRLSWQERMEFKLLFDEFQRK